MANYVMGIGYIIIALLAFFSATSPSYRLWGIILGVAAVILAISNFMKK